MSKNIKKTASKPAKTDFTAIKKLLRYSKPYLGIILAALFCALVQITATLLAPVIIGRTVDYIIGVNDVNFEIIFKNSMILLGLIAAAVGGQYLSSVLINRASFKIIRDLRIDAFNKLNTVPLSFIDKNSRGDLMARVGSDIDQISDGLIQGFQQLFSGVVTIAGTLVFMLIYNPLIAIVVVLLTPLSLFVAYFIAKGCHNTFALQAAKRGEMSGLITEMFQNQRVVKLFGYESRAEKRFAVINADLKKHGQNAAFFSAMVNPCTRFINNVVYVAVCMLGAYLVVSGKTMLASSALTVGGLSCVLSYSGQYAKPFNEITGVITELQTASAAAKRVFDLLESPDQPSDENCAELNSILGDVKMENVDFSYVESVPLIKGLSLHAAPGEKVAIVGPTGCGKTTLINLLMRFYDVNAGSISVDGTDIRNITRHSLRRNYGMVLQETWLKEGTIRDNIVMGKPDATEEEIIAAAKAAHSHGFITRLPKGYDTVIGEDGGSLSQGQKQLLCITRVMLCLPPMLILDEATSSIDTRTEQHIQHAFAQLMQGRTSFIVAHRLSTIKNADMILVMKDGDIIEKGKHDELVARGGFYAALYNSQFAR